MHKGSSLRFIVDEITEGQLDWAAMNDTFDYVALGDPSSAKRIPLVKGRKDQIEELIKHFPDEEKAIRKFYATAGSVRSISIAMGLLKLAPLWFSKLLIKTGLFFKMFPSYKTMNYSLQEFLDRITDNKDLQAVLSYNCLDYGTFPSEAPAGMHFILCQHFAASGGYYPVGGSSEIPYVMVPIIERNGGKVMVRAPVTQILLDEQNKKAVGVTVNKGGQNHTIHAPLVVSSTGLKVTRKLLPKQDVLSEAVHKTVDSVGQSMSCLQVFIGLKGTAEELGLPKGQNIWLWKNNDFNKSVEALEGDSPELDQYFPMSFISFPSTKDPVWEERFPGKSTCLIISGGTYKWFEEWVGSATQHRGKDYEAVKKELGTILWNDLLQMYPQLEDKVEYLDVGTPLTFQYYLGAPTGEIYGMDHNIQRFSAESMTILRPETQFEGLYLAGQDVAVCGITGGMMGSILCTSAILKRNIVNDIMALRQKLRSESKKSS
jgi:all-trans-retinol 13,14-reductase